MRIVIVGASGLIGGAISRVLDGEGPDIVPIGRKQFKWDIHDFKALFREADVLINLAGAPVLKRWSTSHKKKLYKSRIDTAEKIHTAFKLLKHRPRIYIAASAIGIYEPSDELHTEQSKEFDQGFLGRLVADWEQGNAQFADLHNVRVIIMRLGVVLSRQGGAYPRMARPFKWGVGGRIGKGLQGMSYIHLSDLVKAVLYFITTPTTSGVYNLTAPNPVSNRDFSRRLAKALKRPGFMIIPGFMLKLLYGEAAQILINSPWVVPEKLQDSGFEFDYPDIQSALVELTSRRNGK